MYLKRLLAMLLVLGIFPTTLPAVDCSYFVSDSTGKDSNLGTSADSAWQNISKVNTEINIGTTFHPGDGICFKRGDVFDLSGLLIKNLSGEPGNPITFGAYGSEGDLLPILDGSKLAPIGSGGWLSEGNNLYSRSTDKDKQPNLIIYNGTARPAITTLKLKSAPAELVQNAVLILDNPYGTFWVTSRSGTMVSGIFIKNNQVIETDQTITSFRYVVNGKELEWAESPLEIEEVVSTGTGAISGLTEPGHWYWDTTDKRVYLSSATVPDNETVQVNWVDFGIRVQENSQHVIIQDIAVQNFNKQGVVLYNSLNVTVQRLRISGCAYTGIQMYNTSNSTVQDNTIDSNTGGISLYTEIVSEGEEPNKTINNQIRNNSITNSRGAGIGLSRNKGPGARIGDVSGNTVSGNTIINSNTMTYDGAGVYTWWAGSNTIQSNTIRDGGSLYLRSAGIMIDMGGDADTYVPMIIDSNIMENNSTAGIALSGVGHQLTGNSMTNNGISTMDRPQIDFFGAGNATHARDCTVTGNSMVVDTGYHFIRSDSFSSTGHVINRNTYEYKGQDNHFLWPPSNKWKDFYTWQSTTGHDADSKITRISSILLFLNGYIHKP